jgi:hypothetical protein
MWFVPYRVVVPSLDVKWCETVLHCIYYHVMELLCTGFGFITGFTELLGNVIQQRTFHLCRIGVHLTSIPYSSICGLRAVT